MSYMIFLLEYIMKLHGTKCEIINFILFNIQYTLVCTSGASEIRCLSAIRINWCLKY